MARIDLNIVDRGIQGTEWTQENVGLTAEHLDEISEMKTDNSGALNSLPTPFARFFVAKEAFRRVKEEYMKPSNEAGFAYRQLVSDILDVYELLFNLKYHRNNSWKRGETLELREWDAAENLAYIKRQMPVLYNSVDNYYKDDIKEKKLYFLIYTENGKERLLACTSPYTGFVTPPDMDKSQVRKDGSYNIVFADETSDFESKYKSFHLRRKSGGEYFRDIKMFEDRDADFKNYMFNVLFASDDLDSRLKTIKEYIRSFKNDNDIRNDYSFSLTEIQTDQNDSLVVNGLCIMSSDEIDINSYFTSTLIRLPYRISRDNYISVKYKKDDPKRDYDFLMPFKPEVLALYENNNIDSEVHINRQFVTVYLRYQGKTYDKEYAIDPFKPGQGRIVDLNLAKINFDLGLFPNILSHQESENNYFKIFVVAADEDKTAPNFDIDKISLSFYKNGEHIREIEQADTAQYGVLPEFVRSRQKSDSEEGGTKFYELFGTSFDAVEVTILGNSGLLIPVWKISKATNDTYTYAIDLGTSNTFVSRKKNGANYMPELFKMDEVMVSYLHEVSKDGQFSITRLIENSIFDKAKNKVRTEFLPALIDGKDYCFPIRTALCGIRSNTVRPKLFDNYNIAFFYEKLMPNNDQNIHTDIKWEEKDELLRIFVRELLLIIKCDILYRNGDLDRTQIIWFRPLSFTGTTKSIYDDIWYGTPGVRKGEPENILFVQPSQIQCYSESEAPYYFFKKKNIIANSDAVTVIDIGGGSTDFVYFKDNEPKLANSVHFGCDVLWDNGFIDFDNARENGIYKKYASTLRFDKDELNDINNSMKIDELVKTKDIINFWLSNSKNCDIIKQLRDEFKPVFIYHLTSILFYMSCMYNDKGHLAPKTIVFSGNGSKYIDTFISIDKTAVKRIVDLVFERVFGGEHNVNVELPQERKESTCYGGLYREPNAPHVPEFVYQGDTSMCFENVGEIVKNYDLLKRSLMNKYDALGVLYKDVLNMLKKERIIDSTANTSIYVNKVTEDMGTPLDTYFKTQVKEKFQDEVLLNDSVFFLPIINRIFELTKI